MADTGFTDQTWQLVAAAVHKDSGASMSIAQCQSYWHTALNGKFKKIEALRAGKGFSGFGWDAVNFQLTATDSVWEDYIAAHPTDGKWLCRNAFPLYNEISQICENRIATGQHAIAIGGVADADAHAEPEDVSMDEERGNEGGEDEEEEEEEKEDEDEDEAEHAAATQTSVRQYSL
ncbi:hypothetical protein PsYK624_168980 [Phanerochaete sordida]|uniref:Myb/SANT-like domain-containing protein n=1 Tax=Phanerochaete sordida TaxID=48140 RepID=A0A9P3GTZ1_9APHY|nr:hypothetical protein PsYK624_168980 [Phanerochaete sordida]